MRIPTPNPIGGGDHPDPLMFAWVFFKSILVSKGPGLREGSTFHSSNSGLGQGGRSTPDRPEIFAEDVS